MDKGDARPGPSVHENRYPSAVTTDLIAAYLAHLVGASIHRFEYHSIKFIAMKGDASASLDNQPISVGRIELSAPVEQV